MNKLSFVLVGLVVMLSGLMAMVTYVSSNQVFVEAQVPIKITLNFGNVFPGQEVRESFTITSTNSSAYTVTLASVVGVEDIRPFLMVEKDPSETDPDGPISGAPEYTGLGSFTSPDDLSDKWMVTFKVPDVTLPAGTALDYGCQIVIAPK